MWHVKSGAEAVFKCYSVEMQCDMEKLVIMLVEVVALQKITNGSL